MNELKITFKLEFEWSPNMFFLLLSVYANSKYFLDPTLGGFGHFSPRDRDQSPGRSVSRSPEWPKTAADWKGLHNLPGAPYKSQIRR